MECGRVELIGYYVHGYVQTRRIGGRIAIRFSHYSSTKQETLRINTSQKVCPTPNHGIEKKLKILVHSNCIIGGMYQSEMDQQFLNVLRPKIGNSELPEKKFFQGFSLIKMINSTDIFKEELKNSVIVLLIIIGVDSFA